MQCEAYKYGEQAISRRGRLEILCDLSVFPSLERLHVEEDGASHCMVMQQGRHAPEQLAGPMRARLL